MTKEDLREYLELKKYIQTLENRLAELDSRAMKITSTIQQDVVDGTRSQDKICEAVILIIELQELINDKIIILVEKEKKIMNTIEDLPVREKRLFYLRYIEGLRWEEVAVEMGYSWQHIHRLHSIALRMLNKKRR